MIRLIILNIFLISGCSSSIDILERYEMIYDGDVRTYHVFEPKELKKNMTLVVGLHGYTGTPNTFIRKGDANFNKFLDSNNFLGVYPSGKSFKQNGRFFSSWNDLTGSIAEGPKGEICDLDRDYYPYPPDCKNPSRCTWASCADDIGFIEKTIDQLKIKYDIKEIIVVGMSNGGMMAQAIGCKLGNKIDAIVNIAGMQHLGMSCIPKNPVSMVIYGANFDSIVPPKNIRASDGYFYEPMENTVYDWKEKLECKSKETENLENPTKVTIVHYYDCIDNESVTSIFDHDGNHDWPKPYKYGINLLFEPIIN